MATAARGHIRSNSADKPWADAIRIAAHEKDTKTKSPKLRIIAEKTVEMAMAGDMEAIKEIGNRLDGKAKQQMDIGGDGLADLAEMIRAARVRARPT